MENNVLIAFLMTAFAGLSTGLGSLIALLSKKNNTKFLSATLGFSAGVMVYVSFVEIFPNCKPCPSIGQKKCNHPNGSRFFCWNPAYCSD